MKKSFLIILNLTLIFVSGFGTTFCDGDSSGPLNIGKQEIKQFEGVKSGDIMLFEGRDWSEVFEVQHVGPNAVKGISLDETCNQIDPTGDTYYHIESDYIIHRPEITVTMETKGNLFRSIETDPLGEVKIGDVITTENQDYTVDYIFEDGTLAGWSSYSGFYNDWMNGIHTREICNYNFIIPASDRDEIYIFND